MSEHITFLSDGVTVKCASGTDIKVLTPIRNFGSIKTEHSYIKNPYLPGAQINHIHDSIGEIPLTLLVPVEQRSFYLHYFRVNSTGTITADLGNGERFAEYIIKENSPVQDNYKDSPIIDISLSFPYPYWKDVYGFGENLGERIPLLWQGIFRLRDEPIIASYAKFDRKHAVTNTGEVPVGFYMQIKTTDTATNPKIMLLDKPDVFIRVGTDRKPVTIVKGDLLEISTITENTSTPGVRKEVYVRLNGENILNLTDQFSTPFQLDVGRHEISYDADDGVQTLQLWLWRNFAWSWV